MDDGLKQRALATEVFCCELDPQTFEQVTGIFSLGNSTKISLANTGFDLNPVKGTGPKTRGKNIDVSPSPKDPEISIENDSLPDIVMEIALNCAMAEQITVAAGQKTETVLGENGKKIILENEFISLDNNGLPIITITTPTASAGTGYLASADVAVGAVEIPVDTGTGAIAAGQTISIDGVADDYVVKTGITGAGTLVLQRPLKESIANNAAITVVAQKTLSQGTDFEHDSQRNNIIEIKPGVLGIGVTALTCVATFDGRYEKGFHRTRKQGAVLKLWTSSYDWKNDEWVRGVYHTCYLSTDSAFEFITPEKEVAKTSLKLMPIYNPTAQVDFDIKVVQKV